jgi:hypothetical protein
LLARLLLEPPREIPEEARRTITAERERATKAVLRVGTHIYFLFLAVVPLFWWLGTGTTWPFVLLLGMMTLLTGLTYLASRRPRLAASPLYLVTLALHAAMLAVTGLVFGPILILPPVLIGSLAALVMVPTEHKPWIVAAFMTAALAVPLALEWSHVTPSTFELVGKTLNFHPWAVDLDARSIVIGWVVVMALQIFATTAITDHYRIASQRAQVMQHVRAWHLRQLLPGGDLVT